MTYPRRTCRTRLIRLASERFRIIFTRMVKKRTHLYFAFVQNLSTLNFRQNRVKPPYGGLNRSASRKLNNVCERISTGISLREIIIFDSERGATRMQLRHTGLQRSDDWWNARRPSDEKIVCRPPPPPPTESYVEKIKNKIK